MTHRERVLCLLGAIAILPVSALLPGCSHDCSRPGTCELSGPYRPRTSAENLMHNFRLAYQYRDLTEIDSLLSADFIFYFSEQDQTRPEVPESWPRQMEAAAHEGMFDREFVAALELSFAVGEVEPDSALSTEERPVWVAEVTGFDLDLYGVPPSHPGEAPQHYAVDGGSARFWFVRTAWEDPCSGSAIWKIVACRETTVPSRFSWKQPHPDASGSWGSIKNLFR